METLALRVAARFMTGHVQTFVKVNAPVDEGIASVVDALNQIPRLHTIASCEGNDEYHEASVWLRFGDRRENLSDGHPSDTIRSISTAGSTASCSSRSSPRTTS